MIFFAVFAEKSCHADRFAVMINQNVLCGVIDFVKFVFKALLVNKNGSSYILCLLRQIVKYFIFHQFAASSLFFIFLHIILATL